MAQDLVTLYNLALDTAGVNETVSSPTEESLAAETCQRWYPFIRDTILRAAFWPDARKSAYLAVHQERDTSLAWVDNDVEPGWRFAYKQPADCLYPRYLSTYRKFTTGMSANNERLVFCEEEQAALTYTREISLPEAFGPDLFMAIVAGLASKIAMPLHSKINFVQLATGQADAIIENARVTAANEEDIHFEVLPFVLEERGYTGALGADRFLMPYGPNISALGGASVK